MFLNVAKKKKKKKNHDRPFIYNDVFFLVFHNVLQMPPKPNFFVVSILSNLKDIKKINKLSPKIQNKSNNKIMYAYFFKNF